MDGSEGNICVHFQGTAAIAVVLLSEEQVVWAGVVETWVTKDSGY